MAASTDHVQVADTEQQQSPTADDEVKPNLGILVGSTLFVAIVAYVMCRWGLARPHGPVKPVKFATGYVPYLGIVAVTAALERALEPLSWLNATNTGEAVKGAVKGNKAKPNADTNRTQRTILFWALASACGLVISGSFGLFLLQSVAARGVSVNPYLDLVVTGLTIGAGTKPIHDLIAGVQKTAASKQS